MKRVIIATFLSIFVALGLFGQTFDDVESAFSTFSQDLSAALPFSSTIGLNWSDSYIGEFPHLGAGVVVGAVGLPAEPFDIVVGTLTGGATGSDLLDMFPAEARPYIESFGMPFPSVAAEARLGGFGLPFDVGLKVGLIPESVDVSSLIAGLDADYLLIGGDVRIRILEEKRLIPEISIGGGYNYLSGGLRFQSDEDIAIGDFEIPDPDDPINGTPTTYNITLSAPEFGFDWETSVFDVKAQISKRILVFTPYVGIGGTYGSSQVHGGAYTTVQGLTTEDLADIEAALEQLGEDVPQLDEDGFTITGAAGGFAARAYGGLSLDLLFLRLNLTGYYEIMSKTMGASVGLRMQF